MTIPKIFKPILLYSLLISGFFFILGISYENIPDPFFKIIKFMAEALSSRPHKAVEDISINKAKETYYLLSLAPLFVFFYCIFFILKKRRNKKDVE